MAAALKTRDLSIPETPVRKDDQNTFLKLKFQSYRVSWGKTSGMNSGRDCVYINFDICCYYRFCFYLQVCRVLEWFWTRPTNQSPPLSSWVPFRVCWQMVEGKHKWPTIFIWRAVNVWIFYFHILFTPRQNEGIVII